MKKILISIAALLTLGILIPAVAIAAAGGIPAGVPKWIYVINAADPSITVLDAKTLTVYDSMYFYNVEHLVSNHFITMSNDRYLWTCINMGKTGAQGGYVRLIDVQTKKEVPGKKWFVGCGVANRMTDDQKYVFMASPNQINVFDVQNQAYLGAIPSVAGAHQYWINAAGTRLWEGGMAMGAPYKREVHVYDISGLPNVASVTMVHNISVNQYGDLHGMILHPNERYAFVGPWDTYYGPMGGPPAPGEVMIAVIDTSTLQTVATVRSTMAMLGYHTFDVSPDHRYLTGGSHEYSKSYGRINISTLDTPNPDFSTIKMETVVDIFPSSIGHTMYTLDGKHILMTVHERPHKPAPIVNDGKIFVINANSFEIERAMITGRNPHGMVYVNGHAR